ncbi:PilZ domain-containing protein [Thioalkalivibrio thiocyanoxidans]|uniref:PilZ domain-containing protein n=1 Tax=Thioalkalivibrio thiocyanoxidans TaxID=152475 RepID=UPI00035E6690|nr:PilZ domain-containing protein [Thioalkalivibrio thiocyanoxidans]
MHDDLGQKSLAQNLAEFWHPAMLRRSWSERLDLMSDIYRQLHRFSASDQEYERWAGQLVAAVIERLGEPPITDPHQADLYACSPDPRHWSAAFAWRYGGQKSSGRPDQRCWPRYAVNLLTEIGIREEWRKCRLIDLSRGGARIALIGQHPYLPPETTLQLVLPTAGTFDSVVVSDRRVGLGLRFLRRNPSGQRINTTA